jgi:hypothetical protein
MNFYAIVMNGIGQIRVPILLHMIMFKKFLMHKKKTALKL